MGQQNCTFEKVEILPHNIGDLKLNSFPDPFMPANGNGCDGFVQPSGCHVLRMIEEVSATSEATVPVPAAVVPQC